MTQKEEKNMAVKEKKIIENIVSILAREQDITYEEQLRILELLRKERR